MNAYLSLVSNIDKTKGNAYNIGSGEKITIEEIVNLILSKVDKSIEISYKEKNFPEISHQYLDSSKIKNDIGWEHSTKLEEGIIKTISSYRGLFK